MNNFDKPKLIDKSFLKKLIMRNTKKSTDYSQYWDMIKQNILIILFLLLLSYFLYYRYNQAKVKAQKEKEIQEQQIIQEQQMAQQRLLQQQYFTSKKKVIDPRTREQTRFIPEDQQYAVPRYSQEQPYLKQRINDVNSYVEQNTVNPQELPDMYLKNNVDPINLNFNYLEQVPTQRQKPNEFDYSLKTRSATFLTPQYIGPNFAPL